MTPSTTPELSPVPKLGTDGDVIGALLEALTSRERYRLIQRGGELFIEPVARAS